MFLSARSAIDAHRTLSTIPSDIASASDIPGASRQSLQRFRQLALVAAVALAMTLFLAPGADAQEGPVSSNEVSASVSCLGGAGRIDYTLTNLGDETRTFTVQYAQIERANKLAPGESVVVTITGRRDGSVRTIVFDQHEDLWGSSLVVDCVEDPSEPYTVSVSCLAERGRVDVTILNPDASTWFDIDIGPITRSVWATTDQPTTVTVTGRPEGPLPVTISSGNAVLYTVEPTVDCVEDQTEIAVVSVSCLAGNGRIDVSIRNDSPEPVNYSVEVGSVFRPVTIDGNTIQNVAVTGRPDGINLVAVVVDTVFLHIEEAVVACD